ncbi:hypothetical protein C8A01DRAFT_35858 [Parachaetomium inaequale]|uniref:Uncharacterized protein n=1 Tax=Parachaetomium inaequale TaxID=2588326 RepID=A0AAN6PHL4_9PEZI|nr:hypothetical protein C8A01DRAFT_35858 [Parachaetomium inaequale]
MENETPGATSGAAGSPATAKPAAAPAAPSIPAALPTFRPGDARHTISTVQRSSDRSSGSQGGLRVPDTSLASPLAGKSGRGPENDGGGTTGQTTGRSSGARGTETVAGGVRGPVDGEGDQGDNDDDPDSEPEFPKAQWVLYRASDLMPSSPPGSRPVPADEHQTAGGAHGTELEGHAPEPPRLSGPPGPEPKQTTARPPIKIAVKGYHNGTKASIAHPAPDANNLPETAEDKEKTTAASQRAASQAPPKLGDNSSAAGGELKDEEEADKEPSPTPEKPSKKPRLDKGGAASLDKPSGTSGRRDNNTPLDKPNGASTNSSNQASKLAGKQLCARKCGATATGLSGSASESQNEEPRAAEPGSTTANVSNEAPEHPQEHATGQPGAASVAPAFHAGPPFGSIEALFPKLIPGEGTCHPSDLTDPDSALPDMIHEYNLSQAQDGTLFSSTIETFNWVTTASTNNVDVAPQILENPPPQVPARPFRFPRSGMNPFVGARLPAAWGRIRDLVNASDEPNPLVEGIDVPPALPRTISKLKLGWARQRLGVGNLTWRL